MNPTTMEDFDDTLTPEERAAPTFLEWSDATIARSVRSMAAELHDEVGFTGIAGTAATLVLEKLAREKTTGVWNIRIGNCRVLVTLQEIDTSTSEST